MNRIIVLYVLGIVAIIIAIIFPSLAWLSPVTFMLLIPLAVIWTWKSEGRPFGELGYRFSAGWFQYLVIGLFIGLAIPILFQVIQVLGAWIILIPRVEPLKGLMSYLLLLIPKMVFVVALEEIVFRGYFLQALSRKSGVWLAAIFSSLLWGAGHLTSMVNSGLTIGYIIIGMTTFLVWGIALSLCYRRAEKSLWLPYGLHLGVNICFSLVGWFFITQPNAPMWWIGHPAWSPESGLIGILVWILLVLGIYGFTGIGRIHKRAAD